MFAERAPDEVAPAAVDPEDAFAGILLEVEVANLAVAAGQVQGEAGRPQDRILIQGALRDLHRTIGELEESAAAAVPGSLLGFRSRSGSHVVESADAKSAATTFSQSVQTSIDGLVTGSSSVTLETWTHVRGLIPGNQLLDGALDLARGFRAEAEPVGMLIDRGIRKLQAAVDALMRLLGLRGLDAVGDRLAPVWEKFTNGELLAAALRRLLHAERLLAEAQMAIGAEPRVARLDDASGALRRLDERFAMTMGRAAKLRRVLTAAVTLVGGLMALLPGLNLNHLALAVAGYLMLLAGVVLMAMDYADSGTVLGHVDGVQSQIAKVRA
jgi:hypothetical protein